MAAKGPLFAAAPTGRSDVEVVVEAGVLRERPTVAPFLVGEDEQLHRHGLAGVVARQHEGAEAFERARVVDVVQDRVDAACACCRRPAACTPASPGAERSPRDSRAGRCRSRRRRLVAARRARRWTPQRATVPATARTNLLDWTRAPRPLHHASPSPLLELISRGNVTFSASESEGSDPKLSPGWGQ